MLPLTDLAQFRAASKVIQLLAYFEHASLPGLSDMSCEWAARVLGEGAAMKSAAAEASDPASVS